MKPFRPAPWMWSYVVLQIRFALDNRPFPKQFEQAAIVGIHPVTLSRALHRIDFNEWFAGEMRRALHKDAISARIEARVAGQALAGKLEQQRLWFELQGDLKGSGGAGDAGKLGDGWAVTINLPRPEPPAAIDVTPTEAPA